MPCKDIMIGAALPNKFLLSADKLTGKAPLGVVLTISKPDSPGGLVDLLNVQGLMSECLMEDIKLDNSGKATVSIIVSKSVFLIATEGVGCCQLHTIQCTDSNKIDIMVTGTPPPQTTFTIRASKVSGSSAYETMIHISKPLSPGRTIDLRYKSQLYVAWGCLLSGVVLDDSGQADVNVQITEPMTIVAVMGYACSCSLPPDPVTCDYSNELNLSLGTSTTDFLLYAGVGLAALGVILFTRKK